MQNYVIARLFFYVLLGLGIEKIRADSLCPSAQPIAVGDIKVDWRWVEPRDLPIQVQNAILDLVPEDFTPHVISIDTGDRNIQEYFVIYDNWETIEFDYDLRSFLSVIISNSAGIKVYPVFVEGTSELANIRPDGMIIYRYQSKTGPIYAKTVGLSEDSCWENLIWQDLNGKFFNRQISFFTADGFNYPVNSARYPADIQTVDSPLGAGAGKGWKIDEDFQDCKNYPLNQKPCTHLGEDWNDINGGNSDLGHPVFAVSRGEVIFAGDGGTGWNGIVVLRHRVPDPDRDKGNVFSFYAHLNVDLKQIRNGVNGDKSQIRTVSQVLKVNSPGNIIEVEKGQLLGYIGPTPAGSTSPHLHFEIILDPKIAYDKSEWVGYRNLYGDVTQWTKPSDFIAAHRSYWSGFETGYEASQSPGTSTYLYQDSYKQNGGQQILGEPVGMVYCDGGQPFQNAELYMASGADKIFGVLNPFVAKVRILSPTRIPTQLPSLWGYPPADLSKFILGLPISDVTDTAGKSSFGTVFKFQDFENGAMEFHQTGKYVGEVFEIHGGVFKKWAELNYAAGVLGLPISDEYNWQGKHRIDFEGGNITWTFSDSIYAPAVSISSK